MPVRGTAEKSFAFDGGVGKGKIRPVATSATHGTVFRQALIVKQHPAQGSALIGNGIGGRRIIIDSQAGSDMRGKRDRAIVKEGSWQDRNQSAGG
ncbi:MAG: hypothetical protein JWQ78_659 [Sediminibacterium sp.]|nr:hypothetical protein [Sediminibacterium sp.]